MQQGEQAGTILAKISAPAAVAVANTTGLTVPDAIQYLTLAYLVLMLLHKLWHMVKEWRTGKQYPVKEEDDLL